MPRPTPCRWLNTVGGRKFFMAMGAGVVDTLLLIFGYLDISAYVTLTLGTVGVYIAADVAEKVLVRKPTPEAEL